MLLGESQRWYSLAQTFRAPSLPDIFGLYGLLPSEHDLLHCTVVELARQGDDAAGNAFSFA